MTSVAQVMSELRAKGNPQARKTYERHGLAEGGNMFGVRFSDLEQLAKRYRNQHELAEGLWETGNLDARLLACKIADPEQATSAELDRWMADSRVFMLVDVLISDYVRKTSLAWQKSERWRADDDEYLGRAGWMLVAVLAKGSEIDDASFSGCIDAIVEGIHAAPNRKREAMNNALIAIGGYREGLRERAFEAADRIGKVEVDHGDTYCKTPDAREYIEKMEGRAGGKKVAKKVVKKAASSNGKKAAKKAAK